MESLDAAAIAQLAQKIGLVTEEQLNQAWEEIGTKETDPQKLLFLLERKGHLTPFHTSKLLRGDTTGYFLGGYRLLYKIASGSFGRVYRADDPRSGRIVAIKVLRRRWSENPQSIEMFHREGKVGMTLQHPNIVEILAVSQDATTKQHYIVMEFVEGGNLREILSSCKKLEPVKAVKLMEDAAAGLAHAYAKGLTHRDVKLTNILVSSQGTAKLVDFGLARLCARDEEQVDRTVDYAGLEKLTNIKTGDVRSDIYFLGCVFYEMLSGRSPLTMTRDRQARMNPRRFTDVAPDARGPRCSPARLSARRNDDVPAAPPPPPDTQPAPGGDPQRAPRAGGGATGQATQPGMFVVEADERLQDAIREQFKEKGYRVFLSIDPIRALDRFRQQPYQALIVDAGTSGEDGLIVFERILVEADKIGVKLAAILILSEAQADWQTRVKLRPGAGVLVRPITMKHLRRKLRELVAVDAQTG